MGQVVQVVPPGADGDAGVTGGVTTWYGRITGAARQYRSVAPRDVSFPRSTACTTCTTCTDCTTEEESEYVQPRARAAREIGRRRRCRSASEQSGRVWGAPGT